VLKIVENLWVVGTPPRTPLGELRALPRPPNWWGGVAAPFPRNPLPLSAFGPQVLTSNEKSSARPCSTLQKNHFRN